MLHSSDIQPGNLRRERGSSAPAQRSDSIKDAGSCGHGPSLTKTALALAVMTAITLGVIGVNALIWGTPSSP